MKDMVNDELSECPFDFNMDAKTFKPGDLVSYRVPEGFDDMPFVGELLEVHNDYVVLRNHGSSADDQKAMQGTREENPVVSVEEALK